MFPFKIVDLTHTIDETIPLWPGSEPFNMSIRFDYHEVGCRAASYSLVAGTGTHMDAPAHFIRDGKTIEQLLPNDLVAPLCVLSVIDAVNKNHDYMLDVDDILGWEKKYGKIPASSVVVMDTGWGHRWPNPINFLNEDSKGIKHFPGFSVEAAQLLLERNVGGIGIDTFSLDAGIATNFSVHKLMLSRGIFFLECLANLDKLPEAGAFICALPLKIKNAPEFPVRAIAFINK